MLTGELRNKLEEAQIEEINLFPSEVRVLSGIWLQFREYTILRN
jgi:hypothetical protein